MEESKQTINLIFAGSMLAEGCVLVPYWRPLLPASAFPPPRSGRTSRARR